MLVAIVLVVAIVFVLLEFHRRLRAVEAGLAQLTQASTGIAASDQEPTTEVKLLATSGRKIEAVRLYRQQSGAELRRAMQVVEALSARGPGAA